MPVAGGPFIQKTGILLEVDSADKTSYSGTGTTWINQIRPGTNNGTLNNISFDSTDAKGALVFTGSNTFVDFGNLGPSLTSSFSFQVAFEPAATASGQPYTILSYASASSTSSITFKLDYTSSNQTVVLTTFAGTGSQNIVYVMSASVASGSWNIVHGTFGTQISALYVNGLGQAYALTTGSVVGYNTSNRLYAGLNYGSTSGYYSGSIGNIIVNNADLDGLDVNKNYNAIASRFSLPVRRSTVTDADAFAFIETAGITDTTQQAAINTLVLGLKSNNLWTKMVTVYPFIGGTATSHRVNLMNPTFAASGYPLTFFGGVTHASTGVTFNGSTGYADGGLTQASFNTSSYASAGLYMRTLTGRIQYGGGYSIVFHPAPSELLGIVGTSTFQMAGIVNGRRSDGTNPLLTTSPSGSLIISRFESTTQNININGTSNSISDTTTGNFKTGATNNKLLIGGYWDTGYSTTLYSTTELAFAFFGRGLTVAESSNMHTLIRSYQIALNRQIV
jgi:hypothetical protein